MSTYDLLEHFTDTEDPMLLKRYKALNDGSNYVAKDVFKDSKLNKLWAKAELAGFTCMYILQHLSQMIKMILENFYNYLIIFFKV